MKGIFVLFALLFTVSCYRSTEHGGRDAGPDGPAPDTAPDGDGRDPSPTCMAGLTRCGGECVDTDEDRRHCGGCGNTCGTYETCEDGSCISLACSPPCPEGLVCCDRECVDTQTDPEHCGSCWNACDPEISDGCTAGRCSCRGALQCSVDQKCCEGAGCRNIMTDPSNCGNCGRQCGLGESCVEGECRCGEGPACAGDESCCSGECIDTSANPENCGGCNIVCDESGPGCVDGECMCGSYPPCRYGYGDLLREITACENEEYAAFTMCCGGACVETGPENCGECGVACGEEETCTGTYMMRCVFSCTPAEP
jgi:hypothetical protein